MYYTYNGMSTPLKQLVVTAPARAISPLPLVNESEPLLKKTLITIIVTTSLGVTATLWVIRSQHLAEQQELLARLNLTTEKLTATQDSLLGYTRYTDYLSESKRALEGQSRFLAARVDREYVQVEHIQKSTLGWKSDATVILKYAVEYSFGFDLRPDQFSLDGDMNGITITLSKPILVASPAVKLLTHEIPSKGVFIDEPIVIQIGNRNAVVDKCSLNSQINIEPSFSIKINLIADDIINRKRKNF